MHSFCQENNIEFRSQRAQTVASIKAIGSNRDSVLCKMSDQQIDTLTFYIRKLAKEHHQEILTIAIKLSDSLGFKRTAEVLRVVQFVVNYVEQVVNEVERRYQEDLRNAQSAQGQNFNREQFDHEYHIQGKSTENFLRSVLENYNTLEMIRVLREEYQRWYPSEGNPSDIKGNAEGHNSHTASDSSSDNMADASSDNMADAASDNMADASSDNMADACSDNMADASSDNMADASSDNMADASSSVTNVCSVDKTTVVDEEADVLYKKHRDFNQYGDLSDNDIYEIVREVTELYLFEGNSELHRLEEATYVSVTDPHIEPLTLIISSNRHNQTVTARLIV
jgi:hypothetical protein